MIIGKCTIVLLFQNLNESKRLGFEFMTNLLLTKSTAITFEYMMGVIIGHWSVFPHYVCSNMPLYWLFLECSCLHADTRLNLYLISAQIPLHQNPNRKLYIWCLISQGTFMNCNLTPTLRTFFFLSLLYFPL